MNQQCLHSTSLQKDTPGPQKSFGNEYPSNWHTKMITVRCCQRSIWTFL